MPGLDLRLGPQESTDGTVVHLREGFNHRFFNDRFFLGHGIRLSIHRQAPPFTDIAEDLPFSFGDSKPRTIVLQLMQGLDTGTFSCEALCQAVRLRIAQLIHPLLSDNRTFIEVLEQGLSMLYSRPRSADFGLLIASQILSHLPREFPSLSRQRNDESEFSDHGSASTDTQALELLIGGSPISQGEYDRPHLLPQ